jgi:hypothetical protein
MDSVRVHPVPSCRLHGQKQPCPCHTGRGLTLVEVLVTLTIFIVLAAFTLAAVREVVAQWQIGERRRVLYEKAAGITDTITDDIRLTLTREPTGGTDVRIKFIGDYDKDTGRQRLMFVRAFEAGPERAITLNAGDGRPNDLGYVPNEADGTKKPPPPKQGPVNPNVNGEDYTGLKIGDFKALGGMAMVGYFTIDQNLYRAIHAPVQGSISAMMKPETAQLIASDVLFAGFEYWSPDTDKWDPDPKLKEKGPERIWDSTRGIHALNHFSLYRGVESLNDPTDDVFPKMVRITIVADSPMPRCIHTTLTRDIADRDREIYVDDTRGFPDGGDENSFILIDDEWIHYKKKMEDRFIADLRGVRARNSHAAGHNEKAVVRTGRTFQRIVYLPNWRIDTMTDEEYHARKNAQQGKPAQRVQQ